MSSTQGLELNDRKCLSCGETFHTRKDDNRELCRQCSSEMRKKLEGETGK